MGGPDKPTLSPEQIALQRQAQADRVDEIRDRVGDETRDLLIRFGRRGGGGISGAPAPSSNLPGALGLFGRGIRNVFSRF